MTTATVHPHRFTRDEYYRIADAGVFQDRRVELIEGEIIDMAPQKNSHYMAVNRAARALAAVFGPADYWVRTQGPLRLNDATEPEPDVAVVVGPMGSHRDHPTTALLVVEVSDTTLAYDRKRKAALYAHAGIPEYWIVNLVDKVLEVHQDPDAQQSHYRSRTVIVPSATISPSAAPTARISVADLLP